MGLYWKVRGWCYRLWNIKKIDFNSVLVEGDVFHKIKYQTSNDHFYLIINTNNGDLEWKYISHFDGQPKIQNSNQRVCHFKQFAYPKYRPGLTSDHETLVQQMILDWLPNCC